MINEPASQPAHLGELLHQLNNDLSLIVGHLDLALHAAGGNEKLLKRLESARAASQRMTDRIRATQSKARPA